MKRLAIIYLAIVVLASLAITVDPLKWLVLSRDTAGTATPPPAKAEAEPVLARAATDPAAVAPAPAPAPAPRTPAVSDLEATTAAVLAGLAGPQAAPAPAPPGGGDDAMAAMSLAALSGLRGLTARPDATPQVTLQGIVSQALRQGQSDAYIDALVNEAVGSGAVSAPAGLVTAEGRVDTAVLLAAIVARSQAEDLGEGDAADPTAEIAALPSASATDVTYTVAPGDSLGALALRFYGDAARYPAIFEANRRVLSAPDRIAVGQKLLIPALSRL
ncbi:MAG: LysM peptidoglycan-binding domain-containing protein [Paracoccaceae bacterium]|nr:MAG: LysM peptidoglycan-binding domain-containing protein [Paracoccaceae bacterium]